jgi:hypothetical protein
MTDFGYPSLSLSKHTRNKIYLLFTTSYLLTILSDLVLFREDVNITVVDFLPLFYFIV